VRTEARIDLAAIRDNVAALADRAASGAGVMAVVKADGYGHGLLPSARAAVDGGASWLGVAFLEEALAVRQAGLDVPLLAWLIAPGEDRGPAVAADVDLGVYDELQLADTVAAARSTGRVARIQLKVDTGLSRGGATPAAWPALCAAAARAEASGEVRVTGLWSHFAFADGGADHPVNGVQATVFAEALEVADRAGLQPEVRHLANSAATLTAPATHYDLVRPGVAVYGLSPVPQLGAPQATPTGCRAARPTAARSSCGAPGARSPGRSAWISSCSTSATTRSRQVMRCCCSALATAGSRPHRTGRSCSAPSTTRS
jgi:alanine racemase